MKNLLLTFSCVSTLTVSSGIGSFLSSNNNTNLTNNKVSETSQALFYNSYQAFGKGDKDNKTKLITNQSISDKKYYSYDLSSFDDRKLSNGVDPMTLFTVDNQGTLQYKSDAQAQIPPADMSMVDNVKTQMEQNKKVTTIKNPDNPVSNSIYSSEYFTGDNSDWKYLQFGGVAKHIDISHEPNVGNNIVNSGHLSETLGLYYIAKAARAQLIDQAVAVTLAQTFINKSSLASSLGDNSGLINQLMELLDYNDDVYNFIVNMPFWNDDKNYSLNFVFDSSNNLIEVYYNNWDNNNINSIVNWTTNLSQDRDPSQDISLEFFYWKSYANTWSDFCAKYPTFSFNEGSYLSTSIGEKTDKITEVNIETKSITKNLQDFNFDNSPYKVSLNGDGDRGTSKCYLQFWYGDGGGLCYNIHWSYQYTWCNMWVTLYINNVTFFNIMK